MKISRRQSFQAISASAVLADLPTANAAQLPIKLIVLDVGGTIIQDRGDVPVTHLPIDAE